LATDGHLSVDIAAWNNQFEAWPARHEKPASGLYNL
jgi:hypothetical protein